MSLRTKLPLLLAVAFLSAGASFAPSRSHSSSCRAAAAARSITRTPKHRRPLDLPLSASSSSASGGDDVDDEENEEARRMQEKARMLRDQIREMESQIGEERRTRYELQKDDDDSNDSNDDEQSAPAPKSLANKRILVIGANGRLGSMVTRHLLRSHPELKEVVAAVHYVGQATTRGYGRLSYEVGAEDGIGSIGAAWAPEDERNASFQWDPETMAGYNLDKLRLVEVELLDPVQVRTICEDVDAVLFCATDFEGNRPRAVASLNAAFLFRAVAAPTKGRVEIEGVRNVLEGIVGGMNDRRYRERLTSGGNVDSLEEKKSTDPTRFVLASVSPDAFGTFETPFGEFNGLKRQGERIVSEEFPSVSYSVLQMGKFDDNFVEEGQAVQYDIAEKDTEVVDGVVNAIVKESGSKDDGMQRRINRRDAARAVVEALLDEDLEDRKVQVYTAVRKTDIW